MLTTTNSVNKLFCYDMISYSQGNRFRRLRLFQSFQVVFFQFFLQDIFQCLVLDGVKDGLCCRCKAAEN